MQRTRPRSLAPFALLAGAALALHSAPSAGADLVRKGGVLGGPLTYEVAAAPSTGVLLVPSLTTGPTPLALIDPTDPRVLGVGIDLLGFISFAVTDGAGVASFGFSLPVNPGLQGNPLYAQAVELTIAPTIFGQITNATGFTLGSAHGSFDAIGSNYAPVFGHSQSLLDDGRVLIAGGYDDDDPNGVKDTVALYDPQTETIAAVAGNMQDARVLHTATRLMDGRILLAGGADVTATPRYSADVFDPATGLIVPVGDMITARAGHTATLLADGRVFVAGGIKAISSVNPLDNLNNVTGATEIFDPAAGTWSPGPNLPKPRLGHAAQLIPIFDWVLISGGLEITSVFGFPVVSVSNDCRRYIPDATGATLGLLIPTAPMIVPRWVHENLLLDNGSILVVGGADLSVDLIAGTATVVPLAATESYDGVFDTWTGKAPLQVARAFPDVARAADGTLVVLGGNHQGDFIQLLLAEANFGVREIEEASQAVTLFTHTGTMLLQRYLGGASTVVDGGVRVVTAGEGEDGLPEHDTTVEIYNP